MTEKENKLNILLTEKKKIRKQVYDSLFRSQVNNAMDLERLEFIILDAEGKITELRQQSLAEPNNKDIPPAIEFVKREIEKGKFQLKSKEIKQQEICEFMKPAMTDKIIARMLLPGGKK